MISSFSHYIRLWRSINKNWARTYNMQNITTLPIINIEKSKVLTISKSGLFASLIDKGLDRLTNAKIEHILCTSSLAAFN